MLNKMMDFFRGGPKVKVDPMDRAIETLIVENKRAPGDRILPFIINNFFYPLRKRFPNYNVSLSLAEEFTRSIINGADPKEPLIVCHHCKNLSTFDEVDILWNIDDSYISKSLSIRCKKCSCLSKTSITITY